MSQSASIQTVQANGVQIAYDLHGDTQNPVVLLVHGLGAPMTAWPLEMVNILVAKGFCVLRIDNRDMGKSQNFDNLKMPNMLWQFIKAKLGFKVTTPYPLIDMMKDTVGVLDALKIESAHIVGASMGGMICQLMAINNPSRVKSLTSIMSHTGNPKLPTPTKEVSNHLLKKPVIKSIDDAIAHNVKTWELVASPKYPTSDADRKEFVLGLLDRGLSASGTARQFLAIMGTPSRVEQLAGLTMPCQVIHGTADPLVNVAGGIETAKAIPNAKLHLIEGMGHDLPSGLYNQICDLIEEQAKK